MPEPVYLDEIIQGSSEWKWLRMGLPTCSQFHRIVTATGKKSSQWMDYISELVSEQSSEYPPNFMGSEAMERGRMMEPRARAAYEIITGNETTDCGFVYRDETKQIGGSPDALVGDDGILEIKCPGAKNHIIYLLSNKIPNAYIPQTQAYLYITGRKWIDFLSWHPEHNPFLIRAEPEEKYFQALDEHLPAFLTTLEEARELIRNN